MGTSIKASQEMNIDYDAKLKRVISMDLPAEGCKIIDKLIKPIYRVFSKSKYEGNVWVYDPNAPLDDSDSSEASELTEPQKGTEYTSDNAEAIVAELFTNFYREHKKLVDNVQKTKEKYSK